LNNLNITKQVPLIPLATLNGVLEAQGLVGFQPKDKALAIAQVIDLINAGQVTIDQVKATKPSATVGLPTDVADQITKAQAQINETLTKVETVREVASRSLDELLIQSTAIGKKFDELSARLNAKVDAVEKPDAKLVTDTLRDEVSKQFAKFRKATPVEVIAEVAQTVAVTRRVKAKDVFDGVLSYEYNGETVDFSELEIEVFDDPSAPARVADYVFAPRHLHQSLVALDDALPDNTWLAGERGTGKTEFVTQLASRLGRKLFRVNFDEAIERADFIGANSIENGSVVWKAGVITQAIQYTGAIVLIDEVGFARPQSIAILHSLCERSPHRSIVISETGKRIPVASHVAFFCADNSNGHGDSSGNFAGVRDQNTAFIDRFGYTLRFEYLPEAQEVALVSSRTGLNVDASTVLIRFANVAREKARAGVLTQPPSLRQLFAWARAVSKGVPVGIAFENSIINKFPADCEAELRGVFSAVIDVANFKSYLGGN
jgi:cobaltochelatase CobS